MTELHLNKIHSYDNMVRGTLAGEGREMRGAESRVI